MNNKTSEATELHISPNTKYILSTSGRPASIARYTILLQQVLKLDIAYLPITAQHGEESIKAENFAAAMHGLGAIGGAISKDIKSKIIPQLDVVDEFARKIGSVNTVVNRNGLLHGYNTDAHGLEIALREGLQRSGISAKNALIYGYGGVSSVASFVAQKLGINVTLTGRNLETARRRCNELGLAPYDGSPCDLFINATSVSDSPLDQAVGFTKALTGCKIVFDHQMPGSYLSEYCLRENTYYIPGTSMYYPQMYKQWELFLEGKLGDINIAEAIAQADNLAA